MSTDVDSPSRSTNNNRIVVGPSVHRERIADRQGIVPAFLDQLLQFSSPEPVRIDDQIRSANPETSTSKTVSPDDTESTGESDLANEEELDTSSMGTLANLDPQREPILADPSQRDATRKQDSPESDSSEAATLAVSDSELANRPNEGPISENSRPETSSQIARRDSRTNDQRSSNVDRTEHAAESSDHQGNDIADASFASEEANTASTRISHQDTTHSRNKNDLELGTLTSKSSNHEETLQPGSANRNGIVPEQVTEPPQETSRSRRRNDRAASRSRAGASDSGDAGRSGETIDRAGNRHIEAQTASASIARAAELSANENVSPRDPGQAIQSNPNANGYTAAANAVAPQVPPNVQQRNPTYSIADSRAASSQSITESSTADRTATTLSQPTSSSPPSDLRVTSNIAGATGARISRYQETKLVQRVLRGMEQLANGGGQVRLRLHPPELGALQMSLRIEGQVLTADMRVESSGARDALMKNLPLLKERLAEQGIVVEQFDVRTDNGDSFTASNTSSWNGHQQNGSHADRQESNPRLGDDNRRTLRSSEPVPGEEMAKRWTRVSGLIDVRA